jgi:prephenate dehydrogenase
MERTVFGFVGLGIMGGSFAKAIRAVCRNTGGQWLRADAILALDRSAKTLLAAVDSGVIDRGYAEEDAPYMLSQCDVVFICLYPKLAIEFLNKHRDAFKSGALVTDISGVKAPFQSYLDSLARPDIDLIWGHPMAGSEKEGYTASDRAIFHGRNYVLMPQPQNKNENLAWFRDLIWKLGFSRITETDFATHDWKIAFTSQLCHVIASALVDSAEDTGITAFGGGSFEDLTRIAMINAPMWTELFLENRDNLLAHINAFEASLQKLKGYIEERDGTRLEEALGQVRERRILMSRKESTDR